MKRVLVAVDGSEYSRKAFEYSLEEAKTLENHLTILRVVPSFGYSGEVLEKPHEDEVKIAEEFVRDLKEYAAEEKSVDVDTKVIMGSNVANEIVKYADEGDYDLIVVGSRGKTELETISLGSVSEGVVKRANCPVLVVR